MTYAGLTISDKPALLGAKVRGAKWVARDASGSLFGYMEKPNKKSIYEWYSMRYFQIGGLDVLKFVHWEYSEPINIGLAIAQIAEMESAENPITNRDKWMQLWNESDEILARQFVTQEWYGTQ